MITMEPASHILKVALQNREVETIMRGVTTAVYIIYNCVSVQQKTTNNSWNYRGKISTFSHYNDLHIASFDSH